MGTSNFIDANIDRIAHVPLIYAHGNEGEDRGRSVHYGRTSQVARLNETNLLNSSVTLISCIFVYSDTYGSLMNKERHGFKIASMCLYIFLDILFHNVEVLRNSVHYRICSAYDVRFKRQVNVIK